MSYRILSLDGGGTWALIQVKVLMDLYGANASGRQVLADFDLVAANSGGSIVAAALIEDYSLQRVLALFKDASSRNRIFAKLPWYHHLNPITWFIPSPRFSTVGKLKGLAEVFPTHGGTSMDQLQIHGRSGEDIKIMFMAYDYNRDRAKYLRSWKSRAGSALTDPTYLSVVEATHASSTAPIEYFDQPAEVVGVKPSLKLWDGGLTGYNNPVLAAVVEALADQHPADSIVALSLGTGTAMLPLQGDSSDPRLIKPASTGGITADLKKVSTTILADPPDIDTFLAHVMLGQPLPTPEECPSGRSSIIRMNPLIQPAGQGTPVSPWEAPEGLTIEEFDRLVKLDLAATADDDLDLIERFCVEWMRADTVPGTPKTRPVRNQPIRASRDFQCEIGFSTYAAAKAAWQLL